MTCDHASAHIHARRGDPGFCRICSIVGLTPYKSRMWGCALVAEHKQDRGLQHWPARMRAADEWRGREREANASAFVPYQTKPLPSLISPCWLEGLPVGNYATGSLSGPDEADQDPFSCWLRNGRPVLYRGRRTPKRRGFAYFTDVAE